MNVYIFCGKGGVGKTNSAVSLGVYFLQKGEKTAIIDYDGGHSVKNALDLNVNFPPNTIYSIGGKLDIVVVENSAYASITEVKAGSITFTDYLAQFRKDLGLIPLADMVNAFFGVPTDVPTLQKFATLVTVLEQVRRAGHQNVIIDVEPTAGFERLLSNAQTTVRSLLNLKKQGIFSLTILGAKWPHIAAYLKAEYIRHADRYGGNIERTAALLKEANYFIVSTPETSPVNQTFEVRKIIERFGGRVHGYIVNNIRGESHEQCNISRLEDLGLPVVKINRQSELHANGHSHFPILYEIGEAIGAVLL